MTASEIVSQEVYANMSEFIKALLLAGDQEAVDALWYESEMTNGEDPAFQPLEFWSVSEWLFRELAARDEVTFEARGLCFWGRNTDTTEQGVNEDPVIEEIASACLVAEYSVGGSTPATGHQILADNEGDEDVTRALIEAFKSGRFDGHNMESIERVTKQTQHNTQHTNN